MYTLSSLKGRAGLSKERTRRGNIDVKGEAMSCHVTGDHPKHGKPERNEDLLLEAALEAAMHRHSSY